MLGLNGGARENWPRIGLESMAAGVPLVCQNLWGWREMIEHGKTGFLFDNDQECQYYLARLAHDEELRMEIIHNARAAVERMADPQTLGQQWLDLFQSLHPSMAEAA
jgi:glycosyltransferase involved in cell wall biosynthesis